MQTTKGDNQDWWKSYPIISNVYLESLGYFKSTAKIFHKRSVWFFSQDYEDFKHPVLGLYRRISYNTNSWSCSNQHKKERLYRNNIP